MINSTHIYINGDDGGIISSIQKYTAPQRVR
jgi:hypothetical protein